MADTKKKASAKKKTAHLKKLVIVESPSKADTIKKYLGSGYEVKASVGHLIDLPRSRMGVNLETFEPDYIVMRDKSKVMKDLRDAAKNASEIILASDPDREGEAIAYHIRNHMNEKVLSKIKNRVVPIRRIKFEEITQPAVLEAINHPIEIDTRLVNAQQSRRVIDRLFGYQLSPLLWKKVKSKLSAGRVQSVALRIICEREDEIDKFVPVEYWEIKGHFKSKKHALIGELSKIGGKKAEIPNQETADRIEKETLAGKSSIGNIAVRQQSRKALPPFITSTLQQAANNILGYSSIRTMMIAQELYEGINLGSTRTGLITYMRTDSTRVSPIAMEAVRKYITDNFDKGFLPDTPNFYANKKSAQDAHEAIRASDVALHPDKIKSYLTPDQYKLYNLIWRRFVASQMTPSQTETYTIEIENGDKLFTASDSHTVFEGYQAVYQFSKTKKEKMLPRDLKKGDELTVTKIDKDQKFTEPPPRYTDASLVKTMEELGIGRPSTYAPTIFTLTKRYYIMKSGKSLTPTELGRVVNKLLVDNFPDLINVGFTAKMEDELDEVEEGGKEWKGVVRHFYEPFTHVLTKAYEQIDNLKGSFDEETEFVCEKCGKKMLKKLGRFGYFLACSGWPDCRNAKPLPLGRCPKCETGQVVKKKGGRGKYFYGCSTYPECDFATFLEPSKESCPNDGSVLFNKREKGETKLICLKEGCGYEKPAE
ncbi:MAG: DNA topoisomerase I [Spirochaetes bacterium GWF1_49_6]|nr:MAG: DNA topoisomerase I [Spirochaetes bacterium GWF1_49_6]